MTSHDTEQAPLKLVVVASILFAAALFLCRYANVWLLTGAAAAISGALVYLRHGATVRRLLRPTLAQIVSGVLLGVLMVAATHLVYGVAVEFVPQLATLVAKLYGKLRHPPGPLAAFPVLLLVIFVEELIWRGLLYSPLRQRYGAVNAVWMAAALYALPQLAGPVTLLTVVAFGCGLIWTAQRARSGSLVAPLVTHIVWDIGVFLLVPVIPLTG